MVRIFFGVALVALLALPAVLICLTSRFGAASRMLLAAVAFVAPLALIWAIHLVPAFNGEAPHNPGLWRAVGILLSASTLIVPWLIYTAVRDRN